MPRGYPCTVTCKKCGKGQPEVFNYCPFCGTELPLPRVRKPKAKKELGAQISQ